MKQHLIVTVIADDKPGVVETLAKVVCEHDGNWEESRMVNLCGKFTGLLLVTIDEERLDALRDDLARLAKRGIRTLVDIAAKAIEAESFREIRFNLVGNDRPGIVHEVAQALAARNINVEELATDYSSMPWSGEPLFEANVILQIPNDSDIDELSDKLDQIADELAVDIELEVPEPTTTH